MAKRRAQVQLAKQNLLAGIGHLAAGRCRPAERYLRLAYAGDPSNRKVLEVLAELKRRTAQPRAAEFYRGVARCGLELRGAEESAREHLRLGAAFGQYGDAVNMWYCFGRFLELSRGPHSAEVLLAYCRQAYVLDPSNRKVLEVPAELMRRGAQPAAEEFYRGVARCGLELRGKQESAADYLRLAMAFGQHGDAVNMRYCFGKFLELYRGPLNTDTLMASCVLSDYGSACRTLKALTSPGADLGRLSMLRLSNPWRFNQALPASYFQAHLLALRKLVPINGLEGFQTYLDCTLQTNLPGLSTEAVVKRLVRLKAGGGGRFDFAGYIIGNSRLFAGDYPGAVQNYTLLLAAGYTDWPVYCRLGEALLCSGKISEGLRCFEKAYAASPAQGRPSVLVWAGQQLLYLKAYNKALQLLRRSGEHYSPCWTGAALYELGDLAGATRAFEAAVAQVPGDGEARTWLGEVYRLAGRPAEALEQFERAGQCAEVPLFWISLNKALLAHAAGDGAGLLKGFRRAERLWPELVSALRQKLALRNKKNPAEAEILKIAAEAFRLCGGYRRSNKYFLPLLLGRDGAGACWKTGRLPRLR